jgi:hypothetical protein
MNASEYQIKLWQMDDTQQLKLEIPPPKPKPKREGGLNWFRSLTPLQIKAGLMLCAAKVFGMIALGTTPIASDIPAIPIAAGILWGTCLIACFVFGFMAQAEGKLEREKEMYEKLKAKFG